MNDLISAVNLQYISKASIKGISLPLVQHKAPLTFGSTTSMSTARTLSRHSFRIETASKVIITLNNVCSTSCA